MIMERNQTNEKGSISMTSKKGFVVTIDGPAGSGKSTVSARLAQRLKLTFLTTGAFYRGLALLCRVKQTNIEDHVVVAGLANYPGFKVVADVSGTQVFIDEGNVSDELNSEAVAAIASRISAYPEVRKALLGRQREFDRAPGIIAEGRDCGTVVFPNADVKIFLTANLDTRAQRRSEDEKNASGHEILKKMASRDQADSSRKVAPMAKADDAVEIDSSSLSVEQVVDKIVQIVKTKQKV
jgi:CMP/dCMP kinase